MMEHLTHYAKKHNCKRIQLHAEPNNDKACGLYKKLKFEEEEMLFFMKQI